MNPLSRILYHLTFLNITPVMYFVGPLLFPITFLYNHLGGMILSYQLIVIK
jgi:hypothetical protein